MTTQPEQILEDNLIKQLQKHGYQYVKIDNEQDLLANLKSQLEKHNKTRFAQAEFKQILNYIDKGNIFERAQILRDRVLYQTDDGKHKTIELLNTADWCKNEFQVTHQITMEGRYKNRYDVTLLINGLPLIQIELKRRGLELKEAFNQINRYHHHSYGAGHGLFQFIQIFVISNGVNTKYYANNPVRKLNFKQTFYWADKNNKHITRLAEFTDYFLLPCHVSKMISKYMVLNQTEKILMVLRPYQFYAVEAILERVKNTTENGYVWHTTGSGKTLTSFKTAQVLNNLPDVHKVVFVVDRRDLDYQTAKEFNSFRKGSVDSTNNTRTLVKQLADDTKLIVTTIQKLNTAVSKEHYLNKITQLRDKRIVFIFDECHRSQFGKTHRQIRNFFQGAQLFGFTGTPIFDVNAVATDQGKFTTEMLFGKRLHTYVITDAIRDENVLKFSVEYIRTFKKKEEIVDIEVEAIDEKEVMEAPQRIDKIVDYILYHHDRKTHSREFNAIMATPNVKVLIEYYKNFKTKQEAGKHNLKIATIFSYQANEDDDQAGSYRFETDEFLAAAEPEAVYGDRETLQHSRDYLESFIADYNQNFGTNFSTRDSKSFYDYYNDIARRVKRKEVDILLVVNMFLTGFDSKITNTLYTDKNLRYHGLIQAYSRTNRILNEKKSQGNIVNFRNLKEATDEAIALFSDKDAKGEILLEAYEVYVAKFNERLLELLKIAPSVDSVSNLPDEEAQLAFVKTFRDLLRLKNVLSSFTEFGFTDLEIDEQEFEDYKSKYLDIYDRVKRYNEKEKISILEDINFELELIHRDEINVSYILKLLAKMKSGLKEEAEKIKKEIIDLLSGETQLRSKKVLIERFIEENLPLIDDSEDIPEAFEQFWQKEQEEALKRFQEEENLDEENLKKTLENYLFTNQKPLRDELIKLKKERPKLKERKSTAERLMQKINDFIDTFINGVD